MLNARRIFIFFMVGTLTVPLLGLSTAKPVKEQKTAWKKAREYLNIKTLFATLTVAGLVAAYLFKRKKPTVPGLPDQKSTDANPSAPIKEQSLEQQFTRFIARANTIHEVTERKNNFATTFNAQSFIDGNDAAAIIKAKIDSIVKSLKQQCQETSFKNCDFPEITEYPYYDLNPVVDGKPLLLNLIENYSTADKVSITEPYLMWHAKDVEFIKHLIDAGAAINSTDADGNNAYDYAYKRYLHRPSIPWTDMLHEEIELGVIKPLLNKKITINWNHPLAQDKRALKEHALRLPLTHLLIDKGYLEEGLP